MLTFLGFDFILIGIGCVALLLLSLCDARLGQPVTLAVPVRGSPSSSVGRVRVVLCTLLRLSIGVGWGVSPHFPRSLAALGMTWAASFSAPCYPAAKFCGTPRAMRLVDS